MDFKESKPIYLQIADRICDEILLGQYVMNDRIPSVREYAAMVEVNANTAIRAYDYLQSKDIIYNKRGIGYFVAEEARNLILTMRRHVFLEQDLKEFFHQIKTLGITMEEITDMYEIFCNKENELDKL